MTTDTVRLEWPTEGHARIVFARPDKHNAWGHAELVGIARATEQVADRGARVVSIVAEGPSFAVGGDVEDFARVAGSDEVSAWLRAGGGAVNSAIARLRALDAAVIVGAQGLAAGGAPGFMWAGDFIIAADDLRINLAYVRIAASPDAGTSWFLPRLANPLRAFELLALGETIGAQQALQWGLVNRVVPAAELRGQVDALAAQLLAVPAVTLRNIKRLVADSLQTSLETQLYREIEGFAAAVAQPEFGPLVSRFLGKTARARGTG